MSVVTVALLAEGVDRNQTLCRQAQVAEVALLAEGVDRNLIWGEGFQHIRMSPSSRRAWIEIPLVFDFDGQLIVALLAEGVDRNRLRPLVGGCRGCRPPRGGRG